MLTTMNYYPPGDFFMSLYGQVTPPGFFVLIVSKKSFSAVGVICLQIKSSGYDLKPLRSGPFVGQISLLSRNYSTKPFVEQNNKYPIDDSPFKPALPFRQASGDRGK